MCETIMIATKVKITNARMQTYWYAGKIGEEFWVTKTETGDLALIEHKAGRWIDKDDCEIITTGKIKVITIIEELD